MDRFASTVLLLFAAALPAQGSGTFLIDPNAGPPAFATIQAGVDFALNNCTSGMTLLVAPGTYTESVYIREFSSHWLNPTVTLKAQAGPGTVHLVGPGDTITLLPGTYIETRGWCFDGFDFASAGGCAFYAHDHVEDVEIRNCSFGPSHRTSWRAFDAVIYHSQSVSNPAWRIHHNTFVCPPFVANPAYGVRADSCDGLWFHDNLVVLNGCDFGLALYGTNGGTNRIYNNLFRGDLHATSSTAADSVAALQVDQQFFGNWIVHNTFFVRAPGGAGCLLDSARAFGTSAYYNHVYGNVFALDGPGTCVVANAAGAANPYVGDGNLFWAPAGEIGRITGTGPGITTLAAWQAASGADGNSLQADPLFRDTQSSPPDLRVQLGSPIVGLAIITPTYVTTDFGGRLRDAAPDAGAYESTGFAVYGEGCPSPQAPVLDWSGTVAIGANDFAVHVRNAPPAVLALPCLGFSRSRYQAQNLPATVLLCGLFCRVFAAPETCLLRITDAAGTASLPLPIPNQPALLGTDVFLQWWIADPTLPCGLLGLSPAGALQL